MRYFGNANQFCSFLYSGGGNWVMGILLLVLIAAFVYMIIKMPKKDTDPSALDILKQRLADGKITAEEFDRLKNIIK